MLDGHMTELKEVIKLILRSDEIFNHYREASFMKLDQNRLLENLNLLSNKKVYFPFFFMTQNESLTESEIFSNHLC